LSTTLDPAAVHYGELHCECCLCREAREADRDDYSTVPVGPVVYHMKMLLDHGHTPGSIATTAGVQTRTINYILAQRVRMTQRETAEKILSISTDEPPRAPHYVPTGRLKPFVDELRRAGYTYAALNKATGLSHTRRSANMTSWVRWETWERITTLYRLLAREGLVDASLLDGVHHG
jgi:hypothetical protein